ncbi:hypothetical protein KM043_011974 [Ampulex compressa]|nr:hypothetical protein KM043_011974 [Ampulex compressa]
MNTHLERVSGSHEGYYDKIKSTQDERHGSAVLQRGFSPWKSKISESEAYRVFQASLLSFFIFVLSYNGVLHGRTEYTLLENGHIVRGYVPSHRTVITLSLGYSAPYSLVSSTAAVMLLYSIISKKPGWSLPSIILYLADLVCDVSDAVVAVWLFFAKLHPLTALLYATGTMSLILGEIWVWLGVLRLYEYRTFE